MAEEGCACPLIVIADDAGQRAACGRKYSGNQTALRGPSSPPQRFYEEGVVMAGERLTPDEFKTEYKRKGWTGKTLAERWGVSKAWVSKVGQNAQRPAHWDDAVRGLPVKEN